MIEIRTLGAFRVRMAGSAEARPIALSPRRAALLIYLVLARPAAMQRRDTLLGLFWPEFSTARGRHALSQAIYTLRRALGSDVIRTEGDAAVGLDPGGVMCDAVAFEDALDAGDLERALSLYEGDLLPGFFVSDSVEFDQWLEIDRTRLRERAIGAGVALADRALAAGNAVGAVQWLRETARHAPFNEELLTRRIALLRGLGDRAGAVREYEAFAARLDAELELSPSPETVALIDAVRRDADGSGRAGDRTPPAAPGPPAGIPAPHVPANPVPADVPADDLRAADARPTRGPDGVPATAVSNAPRPPRRWRRAVPVALATVVLVLAFANRISPPAQPDAAALSPNRVLVANFEGPSGDGPAGLLARMAPDWIAHELTRTGMVDVVPATMALGPAVAPGELRALAGAAGAGLILSGTVYPHETGTVFQVRLTDTRTGALVRGIEHRAPPGESPVESVETLRRRITGALATVLDPRLRQWADAASQPPSFEAYQAFSDGLDLFLRRPADFRAAAERFHAAAAFDPDFTAALIWAINAHYNGMDFRRAREVATSLEAERHRLAPWDRAMLDRHLAFLRYDLRGVYDATRRVVAIAPTSEWRYYLAVAALDLNRPHESLELLLDIDPTRGWLQTWQPYWNVRADARHGAGDFTGELEDLALRRAQYPGSGARIEVRARAALGHIEALDELLARLAAEAGPIAAAALLVDAALELRVHGHGEAAAARMLDRATAAYEAVPADLRPAGEWHAAYGRAMFIAERFDEARPLLDAAIAARPENFPWLGILGSIAARQGDVAEAERIDAALERDRHPVRYGEDTMRRACIAAHLGDPARAVSLLHEAFAQGLHHTHTLHRVECLMVLRGYPPYDALMRPA
jgi:DNA-binding SARP family transcriptional activator